MNVNMWHHGVMTSPQLLVLDPAVLGAGPGAQDSCCTPSGRAPLGEIDAQRGLLTQL
jgi:hypothetical protein